RRLHRAGCPDATLPVRARQAGLIRAGPGKRRSASNACLPLQGYDAARNLAAAQHARFACGTHVALAIALVMAARVAPRAISTMDSGPGGGSVYGSKGHAMRGALARPPVLLPR